MSNRIARALEGSGFRVPAAGSASKGLGIAFRERPDVVLAEVALSGVDGATTCSLLVRPPAALHVAESVHVGRDALHGTSRRLHFLFQFAALHEKIVHVLFQRHRADVSSHFSLTAASGVKRTFFQPELTILKVRSRHTAAVPTPNIETKFLLFFFVIDVKCGAGHVFVHPRPSAGR